MNGLLEWEKLEEVLDKKYSNTIQDSTQYKEDYDKMRKVITYGTFDLFHIGHLNILKRAKSLGDYLIVAVSSDKFNEIKGKRAYHSIEDRIEILSAIKYVDEVIIEETWEQKYDDIKKYNIDVFVMGDDWEGKFDYLSDICEVIYLERTEAISTTKIKEDLKVLE